MDHFDNTGLIALICRHNIPLFFTNIDTPGEQQKYAVSLLEELFSHLPIDAMVVCLYDIDCELDRSRNLVSGKTLYNNSTEVSQYNLFSASINPHLMFVTSAMHAYAHQWACQLVYNPQFQAGLGLSDGEGVKRLWSCLRKLIGITQCSGVCILVL
jgi:hypothetical protein